MSQTKVWAASAGTSTRVATDGSPKQGSGNSKRMYVGRHGGYDYRYWLRFATDWSSVGRILKATLVFYTDDFGAIESEFDSNDKPVIAIRKVTSKFTVGNNIDGTWDASDWTGAGTTTTGQVKVNPTKELNGLNRVDITALVNGWAPKSVIRSDGKAGAGSVVYGLALVGTTDQDNDWSGWSENATPAGVRPFIELVYEYGPTVPNTPTNLAPVGVVASVGAFQGDFGDVDRNDKLRYSEVEVYTSGASAVGQVVTGGSRVYTKKKTSTNTETINARFNHVPDNLSLKRNTNYKWRARVWDQEGKASLWTGLNTFSVTNTDPNAPVLKPTTGKSFASLDGVNFTGGTFSDPDGNRQLAYQVQLSEYPAGDPHWDEAEFVLWDTGKVYTQYGANTWTTPYTGKDLTAGTYYWRARVWDQHDGVSAWSTASIILTADFDAEPGGTTAIQMRPQVPWRIVIKDMYQSDGVTKTVGRGPGRVVAILENAKSVGASIVYNSPGEAHWTLPVDHPQLAVIEPKQTHYSIQFYTGAGWREVFAGLVWDFDATERDIVFYGIDYLALYDYVMDERYDPLVPNKAAEKGGSYYVTAGKNSISYIVTDQLTRAKNLPNSPVGFITIGSVASMPETVSVYSTYQPVLTFVTALLGSHRAGGGKRTRIQVVRTSSGGYQVKVVDDPGVQRDNLRLRYGELVQGYRVVAFGQDWATRFSGIGRTRDGIKVRYNTQTAPGIAESVWGRFTRANIVDGIADDNDLRRRVRQLAASAGKLGKSVGLGLRTGVLNPLDGWDICDVFPIDIVHGSVNTGNFGSGYWSAMALAWEAGDNAEQTSVLTFWPREDTIPPSTDLLELQEISPQAEWQIGWKPPDPLKATSTYWLDQTTMRVYKRDVTSGTTRAITGTA